MHRLSTHILLAALLRSRGFEADTTQEAGNTGASDERQLEYAAGRGLAEFVLSNLAGLSSRDD